MIPWAGPRASTTTYSSLSLTNIYYYLLLLFVVAAAAAPSMLLVAPVSPPSMIALLLLLPDGTTPVSVKQVEAWWGSLPVASRELNSLPGCYPKLADRRLLDLLSDQPIVSVKAAEAKLAEARVKCVTVTEQVGRWW